MIRSGNTHNYLQNEMRLVLVGRTGSGKSATANTILGKKCFKSKASGSSVTFQCKLGTSSRFGKDLIAVDTPGLFDTGMTNDMVLKEVIKCVGMTSPGPHALLFVIAIGRFTQEEEDTIRQLIELFGEGVVNYVIIIFTCVDNLKYDGVSIDEFIRTVPKSLKTILRKCGNRYVAFNNHAPPDESNTQVNKLLLKIETMIEGNGRMFYTNDLYEEAEKTVQRRMREIQITTRREKEEADRKYSELLEQKRAEKEYYQRMMDKQKTNLQREELDKKQKELKYQQQRLRAERERQEEGYKQDYAKQRQQVRAEIEREEPGIFGMIVTGVKAIGKGIWRGIRSIFS